MSSTQMLSSNALTVKAWGIEDFVNMGQKTAFGHLWERGAIHYVDKFVGTGLKFRGDGITYSYAQQLTGMPIGEGGTLDGNEEALNLGSFTMTFNVTRIGVLNPNDDTIEQQRTTVDFEQTARKLIPERHKKLLDSAIFQQLAGAYPNSWTRDGTTWSGNNRLFVTGHNIPPAPSADRIIRAGGAANDESLTSSNTFSLDLVDYATETLALSQQPLETFDDGTLDLYVSPEQMVDLKHDTSGKVQWFNMALAYATSGKYDALEGQMYKGLPTLGMYGNVHIYSAPRVAYGVRSDTNAVITTVRRAVLVGKDALAFASPYGGRPDDDDVPLKYFTQMKDYDYYKGVEGRMIYGLKKNAPSNGTDIGSFVISTYAAPHA